MIEPTGAVGARLPVDYYVYFDALEELVFASGYREEPCFAVLEGEFGLDEAGAFIELTGFSNLQYTGGVPGMHHPMRGVVEQRVADGERPSNPYRVAGVFVGARETGARLEKSLARMQLSLLNVPYQLLLVADPDAERIGAYARDDAGKFVNVGFSVVYRSKIPELENPQEEP